MDHFNLCKGFKYYEHEEHFILVQDFINKADYINNKIEQTHTPIKNELKLKSYVYDILEGLEYIHKNRYVHCDIKLSNLFC